MAKEAANPSKPPAKAGSNARDKDDKPDGEDELPPYVWNMPSKGDYQFQQAHESSQGPADHAE